MAAGASVANIASDYLIDRNYKMIAFCGHGRSGKDTAALMFSKLTGLAYSGSMSWSGKGVVAKALGIPEQIAWDTRHQRRLEWYNILKDCRDNDPTWLVKLCLSQAEVISGIRDLIELKSSLEKGYVKYAIWVDRPGIDPDPTVTYNSSDCTHILKNSGDLNFLNNQIYQLAEELNLIKRA